MARKIQMWSFWPIFILFFLIPVFSQADEGADSHAPIPDGKYDNHGYLVNPARMDLDKIRIAVVSLEKEVHFAPIGGLIDEIPIKSWSRGTGVVIAGRFVLTQYHVVITDELLIPSSCGSPSIARDAKKIYEQTFLYTEKNGGKETYPLKQIYSNKKSDLAILELPPEAKLPSFPYAPGNSDDLKAGNFVYLFGNSLGEMVNMRSGIVSAINVSPRWSTREALKKTFMISGPVYPGDSGGPIVAILDGRYEWVGTANALFFECGWRETASALGFAIPMNLIRDRVLNDCKCPQELRDFFEKRGRRQ